MDNCQASDLRHMAIFQLANRRVIRSCIFSGKSVQSPTSIRRKATTMAVIFYAVEFSDALTTWSANPAASESVTSVDATFDRVIVTDSEVPSMQRFGRVKVSTP